MRLRGAQFQHVGGWAGGVVEGAEPDFASREALEGKLRAGSNFVHGAARRLTVRGGARAALTLAEGNISSIIGAFRFSPTSMVLIAHSAAASKHYAYALDETGAVALPNGAPTELGSRVDLGWNTATPHWPTAVELFEQMFVMDTESAAPQGMVALKIIGGVLTATPVLADLDADGTDGAMKPEGGFTLGSVLCAFGWEDEVTGRAGHILRHSLLAQDPAESIGWDADAYAIVGAQGEPIRAGVPGGGTALVAKYAELHRVEGTPDALPGWQFAIRPVDASLGFGAVNPNAMVYGAEQWWGIGRDGPWSSNGEQLRKLTSARRRSWGQVGDLSAAFVEEHPRRNAIVFGFPEPAALVSGTRASRLWVYDTAGDRWAPDLTHPSRFYMVRTVARTGVVLSDVPGDLEWVDAVTEANALTVRWTTGDTTAQTEVWLQPAGGSSALAATLPAGLTGARLAGLAAGTLYTVRVRHRKGDTLTEYGMSVLAGTRPAAPLMVNSLSTLSQYGQPVTAGFTLTSDAGPRTIEWVTTNAHVPLGDTKAAPGAGNHAITHEAINPSAGAADALDIRVRLIEGSGLALASPPVIFRNSTGMFGFAGPRMGLTQQLAAAQFTETTITVLLTSINVTTVYRLRYRALGSDGPYTDGVMRQATGAPNTGETFTLTDLAPGTRYEVLAEMIGVGETAGYTTAPVTMFTRLPAPVASIVSTGSPGVPVVTVTAALAGGQAGHDLAIRNAAGTFDALHASVASGNAAYQSTVGVCGAPDRYWVRARNTAWPEGLMYSLPTELTISDPCATA